MLKGLLDRESVVAGVWASKPDPERARDPNSSAPKLLFDGLDTSSLMVSLRWLEETSLAEVPLFFMKLGMNESLLERRVVALGRREESLPKSSEGPVDRIDGPCCLSRESLAPETMEEASSLSSSLSLRA